MQIGSGWRKLTRWSTFNNHPTGETSTAAALQRYKQENPAGIRLNVTLLRFFLRRCIPSLSLSRSLRTMLGGSLVRVCVTLLCHGRFWLVQGHSRKKTNAHRAVGNPKKHEAIVVQTNRERKKERER